ncbi:hypothetical protein [Corynebacterium sp. H130]|uniref:hypothetical protein n=1 Tax=Corynebacterium sp. H130 TaxID=3133444 RepID=UPI0030A06FB9
MTTFLTHTPVACTAVLRISRLPRRLRPVVEELMYRLIPSDSELEIPGADPLGTAWCTRWERSGVGTVETRQVLTGLPDELAEFATSLGELCAQYDCEAELRLVD